MGRLKYLALVVLLFSFSVAVFADTSKNAKDEVKPSEATETIDPQQRGRGSQPKAAEAEAEAETDVGVVNPQIRWRGGGCKYGCCGGKRFRRCRYCCRHPQATEAEAGEAKKEEPKP